MTLFVTTWYTTKIMLSVNTFLHCILIIYVQYCFADVFIHYSAIKIYRYHRSNINEVSMVQNLWEATVDQVLDDLYHSAVAGGYDGSFAEYLEKVQEETKEQE